MGRSTPLLLFAALLPAALLAGAAKHKQSDQIDVYVNKVGPAGNPHETYHYYEMPFCRPEKVMHKSLSLGQVMEGDRMAESSFVVKFGESKPRTSLCGPRNLSEADVKQIVNAIERNYYFELFLDDIKIRQKMGVVEETRVFPHSHKIFLFTTIAFFIKSNRETILEVEVLVGDRKEMDLRSGEMTLDLHYTVEWKMTDMPDSERRIVLQNRFFKKASQVHGLSIAASGLSIILILACVVGFIGNSVNRDIASSHASEEVFSETGWKVIATEVFRGPNWPMLHCAAIGVGYQFCILMLMLIVLGITGILDVHYHGSLNGVSVVMYSLTSGVAGFISAIRYTELGGKRWVANINVTSLLFSAPMMIIWALNNTVFWSYQMTRALPWTTVIVLMSIWIVFGYPLTIVGGIVGRHFGVTSNAPCRSRLIPREIPQHGLISSPAVGLFLGGVVPFTSVLMEMPYAFQILWGRAHLDVGLLVLLAVIVLIVTVACNSIALTYVQLNHEDYRWWWRSFFQGASIGGFIFAYGIYFFFYVSNMTGFVQLFEFFSHLLLLCFVVSLAMGSVAHAASRAFVWYMYNAMKSD